MIAAIYKERVETRGYGPKRWGWDIAYGEPVRGGAIRAAGEGPRTNQIPGAFQNGWDRSSGDAIRKND